MCSYATVAIMTMACTDEAVQIDQIVEEGCLIDENEVLQNHQGKKVAKHKEWAEGLEAEESSLMQRKRWRSPTPRRRRRQREERERQRSRQERRHSWTVDATSTRACTTTVSRRPLRAPWCATCNSSTSGLEQGAAAPPSCPNGQ